MLRLYTSCCFMLAGKALSQKIRGLDITRSVDAVWGLESVSLLGDSVYSSPVAPAQHACLRLYSYK